jgi:transcriptional regulatory protein LevR
VQRSTTSCSTGSGTAPQIAGLLGTSGIQTSEMASNTAVKLAEAIMHAITTGPHRRLL